jgi:hypothetical protein
MLRMLSGQYVRQFATQFTTIDFIAHFQLTALEGYQRLNEMAEDGLIASVAGSAGEKWQLTRDGAYVFSPNKKRLTRRFIADVKACLVAIGPELLRQGAAELSVGGRLIEGKSSGHLLIGLRLRHAPFDSTLDLGLLLQLCTAIDGAAGQVGYEIMMFADRVPLRMRSRVVVAVGDPRAEISARVDVIDEDEADQSGWREKLRTMYNFDKDNIRWARSEKLPWGLQNSLQLAHLAEPLPICGVASTWRPDERVVISYCKEHCPTTVEDLPPYFWESWSPRLFATLEFKALANTLPTFCKKLAERKKRNLARSDSFLYPLLEVAQEESSMEWLAARALIYYRSALKENRESKEEANRTKPKLVPYYQLFFDTLNFPEPILVGMVRQPAGNHARVNEFLEEWDGVLQGFKHIPATVLRESGYYAGELSLDVRDATLEERKLFDELCKREGILFRSMLFMPDKSMVCRRFDRRDFSRVELQTPPLFLKAELGRPVYPRLVSAWEERGNKPLAEVIQTAPPLLREVLEANVVSLKAASMSKFAVGATLKPCIDRVVLASGLLDAWTFSSTQEGEWAARAGRDDWRLVLTASGEALHLTVVLGTQATSYSLASPKPRFRTESRPYDNTLGALMSFFDGVRTLCQEGTGTALAKVGAGPGEAGDVKKLRVLSEILCNALHGHQSSWGMMLIDWPYFPHEGKEEVASNAE